MARRPPNPPNDGKLSCALVLVVLMLFWMIYMLPFFLRHWSP